MRLPCWILDPLANYLIGKLDRGELTPHKYGNIMSQGRLYMERGWIVSPRWYTLGWGARVHHTRRSDNDRHLHTHPWFNISVILRGSYYEHVPIAIGVDPRHIHWRFDWYDGYYWEQTLSYARLPGDIVVRKAEDRHRLTTIGGCYSLFIVGPRKRVWGFRTPAGEIPWHVYLGIDKGSSND